MEIGNQTVGNAETVARRDENIGIAPPCFQTACFPRGRFQRAHRGGADRPDFCPLRLRRFHRRHCFGRHVVPFAVHFVFGDVLRPHRLERAGTDMQRYLRQAHAFGFEFRQQRVGEVQACGRCGHCALVFGVHGLVAALVVAVGRPFDIGRQRQPAVLLEEAVNRFFSVEMQAEEFAFARRHFRPYPAVEQQPRAGLGRF